MLLTWHLIIFYLKGGITIYYSKLLERNRTLTRQIQSTESQINTLPAGNIFCTQNGPRYKWFHTDGHKHTYIPKRNRAYAEELAYKKYLSLYLQDLKQEKIATDSYLRHHRPSLSSQLLTQNSEYPKLLSAHFQPLSEEFTEWTHSSYNRNPKFPEQLIHKTSSGNFVRSKSEALIDMLLYLHKIPFRYECVLTLGSLTIYPDFTIRHPKTGQYIYWEHFGLMDQAAYCKSTCEKLQLYMSHGIIPSIHLITTYETKELPLSQETIEKTIQDYFLSD